MKRFINASMVIFVIFGFTGLSGAELIDRGGGLIYDTELDITYLSDSPHTGMKFFSAKNWVENLEYYDSVRGVIWDEWRLPDYWNDELKHLDDALNQPSSIHYGGSNGNYFTDVDPWIYLTPYEYWTGTYKGHEPQYPPDDVRGDIYYTYNFHPGHSYDHANTSAYHWVVAVRDGDVVLPNIKPILDPIGDQLGAEGELLEFIVSATDPDPEDILTLGANNLPEGAAFDPATGLFSWTPSYDQQGYYTDIEFYVTDNGDPLELDSELITITIGNINRPPVFETIGTKEVLENELLEFVVTATDPDYDNFTLSADGLPEGADFTESTGFFYWTPDNSQAGNFTVIFYATDEGVPNKTGELSVIITVGNVPTPVERAEEIIDLVVGLELPKEVENSYLAHLKKLPTFIEDGKVIPTLNQLQQFITKVGNDICYSIENPEDVLIDPVDGQSLIDKAVELGIILDPAWVPNLVACGN